MKVPVQNIVFSLKKKKIVYIFFVFNKKWLLQEQVTFRWNDVVHFVLDQHT